MAAANAEEAAACAHVDQEGVLVASAEVPMRPLRKNNRAILEVHHGNCHSTRLAVRWGHRRVWTAMGRPPLSLQDQAVLEGRTKLLSKASQNWTRLHALQSAQSR